VENSKLPRKKDEMDVAAEKLFQKLKTGAKNVEMEMQTPEEEKPVESPQLEEQKPEEIAKEKINLLPPDEVGKILDPIDKDLEKVEDVLEKIHPKIESISKILPTLSRVKELLQLEIAEKTKERESQSTFLYELKKQEEDLKKELKNKQQIKDELEKEQSQIESALSQVHSKIPDLTVKKEATDAYVSQREENLHIIEEYINRILNLQKTDSAPIIETS
jgi:chromosome segregation ATPase